MSTEARIEQESPDNRGLVGTPMPPTDLIFDVASGSESSSVWDRWRVTATALR
jgi:hypothetical protein